MDETTSTNHKGHILVVDDDPAHLQLLVDILTSRPYRVQATLSSKEALLSMQTELPDLILLDVIMPNISGFDLCRRLKAEARTRDIPVIFVTGLTEPGDKVKAFAAGGVDYIEKPIKAAEALARIQTHLSLQQMRRQLEQKVAELEQEMAARKRLEETLRESELRYRTLFESAPIGIGLATVGGQVLACNAAMEQMLGYSEAELKQINLNHLYQRADERAALLEGLRKDGQVRNFESRFKRKNGSTFYVSANITPLMLAGQEVLLTALRDITARVKAEQELAQYWEQLEEVVAARTVQLQQQITERQRIEEALREREMALNKAQELAQIGSFIWDLRDDSLTWSDNMFAIAGLEPGHFAGKLQQVSQDAIHPDDRAAVQQQVEAMVLSRQTWPMEFRIVRPDGTERLVQSDSEFVFDEQGRPIKCIGIHFDITERRQAEQALRESEELHRVTMENILDPMFITDDAGVFTFICPNIPYILGYSVAEIRAMGHISKLIGAGLFSVAELAARGEIYNLESVLVDKAGREHKVLVTVKRVDINGGTILYSCRDITDRKRAEELLRESEARYHSLVDNMPDVSMRFDRAGRHLLVNRAVEKVVEWPAEQFIGKTHRELGFSEEQCHYIFAQRIQDSNVRIVSQLITR